MTSKRLKIHKAFASLLVFIGFVWGMVGCGQAVSAESSDPLVLPIIVLVIGLVWLLVARTRIWWYHR